MFERIRKSGKGGAPKDGEHPPKQGNRTPRRRGRVWRHALVGLGALSGTGAIATGVTGASIVALDQLEYGVERVDVDAWYQQTITQMRAQYENEYLKDFPGGRHKDHPDTVALSFEQYLDSKNIPNAVQFASVRRIMEELGRPTQVYSGLRYSARLFGAFLPGGQFHKPALYASGSWRFNGHQIFLANVRGEDGQMRAFDLGHLQMLVAETAHSFQQEKGRLTLDRYLLDFISSALRNEAHAAEAPAPDASASEYSATEQLARDAVTTYERQYKTADTIEHEAHERIEPMLERRLSLYRVEHAVRASLPGLFQQIGLLVDTMPTRETFSYEKYLRLMSALEDEANQDTEGSEMVAAERILEIFSELGSMDATLRPREGSDRPLVELQPSRRQYEDVFAFLTAAPRSPQPLSEVLPMPPEEGSMDVFNTWRYLRKETREFQERERTFAHDLVTAGFLGPDEDFTREAYHRMTYALRDQYSDIVRVQSMGVGDPAMVARDAVMRIANGVCVVDAGCTENDFVLHPDEDPSQSEEDEQANGTKFVIRMHTTDAHYEAMRRAFERSRSGAS